LAAARALCASTSWIVEAGRRVRESTRSISVTSAQDVTRALASDPGRGGSIHTLAIWFCLIGPEVDTIAGCSTCSH
jgi:hypothetical protein